MAKFLQQVGGRLKEAVSLVTSAGATDADKLVSTNGQGKLDQSLFPTGLGAETESLPATEALNGGDFVNIYSASGTASVRKADATAEGKEANGFVLDSAASGASVTVYREGLNNALSGLSPGTDYFLSAANPGQPTDTPPSSTGNVVQYIGRSSTDANISFEPGQPITLA
ncbi:hypothetical protein [Salinisphaera hydrothermalis]|uniref:Uncharacterized protein n=1 Tax=Salinisphaera hydrothermalis (strain C41B8) TaxID=1304275 RepID=A0A084INL9_SALHC|nr:hypothetical protein [Salinisphaera hydrothermalis]KEZ78303.1 hypothetical protein C41B8_05358 [Salinisphaera hydrothermalis C41B8]